MPQYPDSPSTYILLILSELGCIFAIATRSSRRRRLYFIPFALLVLYQIIFTKIQAGVPLHTASVVFRLCTLFCEVFDYVFITDAPKELRMIGDKTDHSTTSYPSRLLWAFKLHYGPRNIGWSHEEPAALPPRPTQGSRFSFVISRLAIIARNMLIHDINLTLIRRNPYFTNPPLVWDTTMTTPLDVLRRLHLGPGVLLLTFTSLENQIAIIGIIWVTLGLSDYKTWPTAFGSFWDAYTVRRFWGKAWHQMFRRIFSTPANVLSEALGLPRTGLFQRYFKIFIVFAVSGITHQLPDGTVGGGYMKPQTMLYFLAPALMIMVEDAVISLGRRVGIKNCKAVRLVGYIYVLAWFALIGPLWSRTNGPAGVYRYRMDLSVVDGLLTGNWHPYSNDYL